MKKALVGYTGFVGGNLLIQEEFNFLYNSKNIDKITLDKDFDLIVWSGAKAEKWKANLAPDQDLIHITELINYMKKTTSKIAVLISTVDIYPIPINVDENTIIDNPTNHSYGLNRLNLEVEFKKQYNNYLIIRLPALFGTGLKKNIIFDFMNNNEINKIDSRNCFQFYNLENIWTDIGKALANGIKEINIATEPISVAEIAKRCFGINFDNTTQNKPTQYDMNSIHARLWNQNSKYLYSKEQVVSDLSKFINKHSRKI